MIDYGISEWFLIIAGAALSLGAVGFVLYLLRRNPDVSPPDPERLARIAMTAPYDSIRSANARARDL